MRSLLPDSIAGRTLIVLLVGLTLSHLASTAVLSTDRHDAAVATGAAVCADRIAAAAGLIDRAGPAERAPLARALAGSQLAISLSDRPEIADSHHDEQELALMQAALAPLFGPVGHGRLHVVHRQLPAAAQGSWLSRALEGFPEDRVMAVSFRLGDGQWANFSLAMAGAATLWSPHTVPSTLVMMAAILLFGGMAAGWIGRPLATFAGAADRLGRDVNAPPLPEGGPREMRRAVAAFNEMQARLRSFVEDRTQMLAAISHDLRSPITRLRLRTEMLPESEPRERMLADLAEMEAMVASTLAFARGEAIDEPSQAIDLAATLEAICDDASDLGLAAEFHWPGRLVCTCRPLALKRALANLVENAARYGGKASVTAGRRGDAIEVVVEDQGEGIPEAELDKVFTPFYRLEGSRNRKTGGIGLGLTVARTIVRAHGGGIRLENRPEGGLRATVTIPQEGTP